MVFETILNPIFLPLLKLPIFWAILILAFLITLLMTLVYKWMTDQHLMKTLKDDIKKFQQEMKEFKHDPAKVIEVQKKAMETNMRYMMHSMKPTLITFIPVIIIFGWLNVHLAYEPIMPGQEFTTAAIFDQGTAGKIELVAPEGIESINNKTQDIMDGKAEWKLKGKSGSYLLEYKFEDKNYNQELLITTDRAYENPVKVIKESKLNELRVGYQKVKPIPGLGLGWLGTYIILSIIFSISLRKLLKLH